MKRLFTFVALLISIVILSSCGIKVSNIRIDFDSNGGSEVSGIYFDGKTNIVIPDDPRKEGFVFAG